MKINNFLKVGFVSILTALVVSNVYASENIVGVGTNLDNTEIVKIVKQNISKDDLSYLVGGGMMDKTAQTISAYNTIKNKVEEKYGAKKIDTVQKDLNNLFSNLSIYKNIPISYSYAIPKQILESVKEKSSLKTDSSIAYGAMNINEDCSVSIKLAVDNNGRLFESSDLVASTQKEISKLSNKQIEGVLIETSLHEASHCVLHNEMKDPNWELKFSKEFAEKYPETAKLLNEKVQMVKNEIALEHDKQISKLDYLVFANLNESFSDVMAGFARLGDNPTKESILEAKKQLIDVSSFRDKTDLAHTTKPAVQYALERLDYASTLTMEQRKDLALEIVSDSLLVSVKAVFNKSMGASDEGILATYLLNGLKLQDGNIIQDVPEGKDSVYEKVGDEIFSMYEHKANYGSVNQKILSREELEKLYLKNTEFKYSFNESNFLKLKDKYLNPSSSQKLKKT